MLISNMTSASYLMPIWTTNSTVHPPPPVKLAKLIQIQKLTNVANFSPYNPNFIFKGASVILTWQM